MRKLFSLLFFFFWIGTAALGVHAAAPTDAGFCLKVNPYGGEEAAPETIVCRVSDEGFVLYLPAVEDRSRATLYFEAEAPVTLDAEPIVSGQSVAAFTDGTHLLTCGDETVPLTVFSSDALPAVFLRTESGSLDAIHADKSHKEPGEIRVYEDGVLTLDDTLKQIKGRGNSTWEYPKKPYNVKFSKKTALLGMPKAKKWTLLANYIDPSLLHNAYAWEYATALGLPFTGNYRHVDLYVNGDYLGNYTVCESVEIAENRVDLADLDKANEAANPNVEIEALPRGGTGSGNTVQSGSVRGSRKWIELPQEPEDVTGGYLLEFEYRDRYNQELCGFVTSGGQPVVLKSPEYASRAEVHYIAEWMDAGMEALNAPTGYNSAGRHFSEYFDVDSLAGVYLLQELSMNFDAGLSSFFAFKPAGDALIQFGPVWDMDNAFGSPYSHWNVRMDETGLWWANQIAANGTPSILAAACRHGSFRALVQEKWAALQTAECTQALNRRMDALVQALAASGAMNLRRWGETEAESGETAAEVWQAAVRRSRDFVAKRTQALDVGFGADGAYLYYDYNGLKSGEWASVSPILRVGASTLVRQPTGNGKVKAPQGTEFLYWNTAADGSGKAYYPGDSLPLRSPETVLYAIWRTPPFADVKRGAYYYDAVQWAYFHQPQITSGTDAAHFSPNRICTREEFVTLLWAAAGKSVPNRTENPFRDVKAGKYYYAPILWALEHGVTGGLRPDAFGVGRRCTREQTVTFLWAAAGRPKPRITTCPFSDVKKNAYYFDAVLWAVENGITSGMTKTTFGVGQPCTRAQAAVFLFSAYR